MLTMETIEIDEKTVIGVKVELPSSPPLLILLGRIGFIMCGFLNMDAAEKLNTVAAMVSGVKTFDDILRGEVKAVTSKAKKLGIREGMKGEEAIKLML